MRSPSGSNSGSPDHLALDPGAEDLDVHRRAGLGVLGRQVGVGDRTADRVAVAARRDAPRHLAGHPDRLVAERHRARVLEHQAAEQRARPALLGLHQRLAAQEAAVLVELHAEADAALVGGLVRGHVGAPHAVALLEAQRVDRPVAARRDAVRLARLPQRPPQRGPVLGRAVELVSQLPDVGHPQRPHGHVADGDLAQRHVGEVVVAEALGRQGLEDVARPRPPDAEAGRLGGHVANLHRAVVGHVPADPLTVVVAEGGAGDDREALLGQPRDGEVALDPAARVEHLRVGDAPALAGHAVVAQALQQRCGARAGDLQLGEGALVEQGGALAARGVLGLDRGRPVPAGPASRAQLLVARGGVRLVPVHPLPARLLAEHGPVLGVPAVRGGQPQGAAGGSLVVGIADVVVGLVGLRHAGKRVAGRAVLRAEAPDVHVPQVERGLALGDPLGHHLPDPTGSGQAVGAEPGGHVEPADLGLAEAELVVGGEGLGAVDHARDLHVLHLGNAAARVDHDLLEAVPVVLQKAAVEVRRDPVESGAVAVQEGRRGLPLVASHHQAAGVLAEVDQQVRVSQRGQGVLGIAVAEGLGHQVLVRHRYYRYAHAGEPPELGGEHSAGDHHRLGLHVAAVGAHPGHPSALGVDPRNPGGGEDPGAPLACALGQRVGQLGRVEPAVGGQPGRAQHPLGGHQREQLGGALGAHQFQREPERVRPPGLAAQLLHALLARGQPEAAALHPAAVVPQLSVQLDRVHHHAGQRHRAPQLAAQAGRVEGRARGELVAVDQQHVLVAELGQVIGDRRSSDAPAHDDAAGGAGEFAGGYPRASRSQVSKRSSAPVRARRSKCLSA